MRRFLSILCVISALSLSCSKKTSEDIDWGSRLPTKNEYYVNLFTKNIISAYYLWADEISYEISNWKMESDPIAQVKAARYKDTSGNDIDRWTEVTDDYKSYMGTMNGVRTTNGLRAVFMYGDASHSTIYAVITYTYADSPAGNAGLKRGDVVTGVDGTAMTLENYYSLAMKIYHEDVTLNMLGGESKKLKAVETYEDPINVAKVLEFDGKKIGYLHYTSFTLSSIKDLTEVMERFKKEGVKELVLDLRYNGGGHTKATLALASMIAPESAVRRGDVFMTAVYNDYISSRLGGAQSTKFTTTFEYVDNDGNDQTISTEGKNLNISKLYVITTGRSASASECLICGLKPYMDLKLFGEQTSGKYCGGSVYEGSNWYNDVRRDMENKGKSELYKKGVVEAENWGIYVMLSRYADKNGRTISMPDGITPDIKTSDNPTAMVQLGDPSEPMLAKVLEHAGYIKKAATTHAESISEFTPTEKQPDLPGWGIMIIDQ